MYTGQSEDRAERHQFLEDLKAGTVSLMDHAVFNGWADTFDLLLENNVHADAPLAAVYEDGSLDLATGQAGAWFMGNWALPMVTEIEDLGYKFIPYPISNDANDYANGKLAIGVPSYWCVDKTNNSEAQQKAAVDFLTWFLTTPEGQDYYVNSLGFIPAYSGFEIEPTDAMSQQIAEYLSSGKSLEWMNNYYPAGGFQAMGASMQKYVDGVIDRQGLATEFEDYWKSVE
jgi:raffinose/stachyose/melibiose transport system substrate-binding protein